MVTDSNVAASVTSGGGFGLHPSAIDAPRSPAPINAYLRALPSLRPATRTPDGRPRCKMCGGETRPFANVDFTKSCHPDIVFEPSGVLLEYVRCVACECLFTTFCDDWTTRDFAELIYNDDYLAVDGEFTGERGRRTAGDVAPHVAGAEDERLLDYGSGSGTFSAELVRRGFVRAESYDPYTHPERPSGCFAIVTAFDVIEHSADPRGTLHDMLGLMAGDGCLLIGQTFQPDDIEQVRGDWWYLAPRNGHITTFSEYTIQEFARSEGLVFHNLGAMFALSRPGSSVLSQRIIMGYEPVDRRIVLHAPGRIDGEPFGWHPYEQEPGRAFRWTAAASVSLGFIVLEGACQLAIPFHIAVEPHFLEGSRLRIGDTIVPLRRRGHWLLADFSVDRRMRFDLTLLTPEPFAAAAASGDHRRFGILKIRGSLLSNV